jgi:hypothetical protein
MFTVAVLEARPGLSAFFSRCLPPWVREQADLCALGDLPLGVSPHLLVVSPDLPSGTGLNKRKIPPCRVLLVPGRLGKLAGEISAHWAVSYGTSPQDSLSLTCLNQDTIGLALQREVVTLTGQRLDRQEFFLPRQGHTSPGPVLACAGVQLLLGVEPKEVWVGRAAYPAGASEG